MCIVKFWTLFERLWDATVNLFEKGKVGSCSHIGVGVSAWRIFQFCSKRSRYDSTFSASKSITSGSINGGGTRGLKYISFAEMINP